MINLTYKVLITGSVNTKGRITLNGNVLPKNALGISGNVECSTVDRHLDHYSGEYMVAPSQSEQVLNTYKKIMDGNVTISPIPSYYGLITWNGSTLKVS